MPHITAAMPQITVGRAETMQSHLSLTNESQLATRVSEIACPRLRIVLMQQSL